MKYLSAGAIVLSAPYGNTPPARTRQASTTSLTIGLKILLSASIE